MSLHDLIAGHVDAYFRLFPHLASEKGYARYDAASPSFTADARARFAAASAGAARALAGLDRRDLGVDARIDVALLGHHLTLATFPFDQLELHRRSPLLYVSAGLDGIDHLDTRLACGEVGLDAAIEARLRGLPALLAEAQREVRAPSAPLCEAAAEMVESGIDHLGARFRRHEVADALFDAAEDARFALDAYREELERIARFAQPFTPMGAARYGLMLRHEHLLDPDPAPWLAIAEATIRAVEADLPAVLAAAATQETPEVPAGFGRAAILAYYREEVEAVRRFVAARELVTVPPGELLVRETPAYLAAVLPGASYLPPPAFSGGRTGIFFVRPVPAELAEDELLEHFERVHHRRLRNLIVHEVWPGHHLQFLHAIDHPSALRRYRDNDVMIEGWALYCEGLLADEGLFDEVPSPRPLQSLRFRAVRVLVDVAIHTGAMTLDEARVMMASRLGVPASSPWIAAEILRYAAEPTQAMSYLVGQHLVRALRADYLAVHGDGRPQLRAFHDRFLAEGSIPVPLIRAKLMDEAGALSGAPTADERELLT